MKERYCTQSHEKWLLKAENDLNAAKLLYKANYCDVAVYHTQQCAEKALKGFLAFKRQPLVKIHDLAALVALCNQLDPKFSRLSTLAVKLTPFAVLFRYPDADDYPEKQIVSLAIRDAEKILLFVKKRIEK